MKKLLCFVFILTFFVSSLFAYDFTVNDYKVDIRVAENSVSKVKETFSINFPNPRHGFYRIIPVEYTYLEHVNALVNNVYCSSPFEGYYQGDSYVVKIGSADKYVSGQNFYELSYNYDLGADVNDGYDEFYYNILGSSWDSPFDKVTFSVFVPVKKEDAKIWLTRGQYGSTEKGVYNITESDGGIYITGCERNFAPNEALTLRVELPEGFYKNARTYWDHRNIAKYMCVASSLILIALSYLIWRFKGKDKVPVIVARFNPPDGFSPLETGYVCDGTVDMKDITSMLYYWADKGLITINEPKKNKFSFTKILDIEKSAPEYERILFNALFLYEDENKTVKLESIKNTSFPAQVQHVCRDVAASFKKEKALKDKSVVLYQIIIGFFSIVPFIGLSCSAFLTQQDFFELPLIVFIGFFVVMFNIATLTILFKKWYVRKSNVFPAIMCFVLPVLSGLFISGITMLENGILPFIVFAELAALVMDFFAVITSKRSEYGNKKLEEILGFREYIDKVSMDELKLMIDKDPEYYYHILSYAIVLGLENKWAKKFEDMVIPAPSWYIGYTNMTPYYMTHMVSHMYSSVCSNAMVHSSSSGGMAGGSSFGSSGFSGGGFGGGGGHSW